MLLMGKSTIIHYKWPFSIAMLVYQRVPVHTFPNHGIHFSFGARRPNPPLISWARLYKLGIAQPNMAVFIGKSPKPPHTVTVAYGLLP